MTGEMRIGAVPDLDGLAFRRLREGDAAGLAAVQEGRKDVDGVDPLSTFEHVPTVEDVAW